MSRKKYSDSELLDILRSEFKKLGRTPTVAYFNKTSNLPSSIIFQKRWGSWNNAVIKAGLEPNPSMHSNNYISKESPKLSKIELIAINSLNNIQKNYLRANPRTFKNLVPGFSLLYKLIDNLELNIEMASEAYSIYVECHMKGLFKGRTFSDIAAASMYIACRKNGIPRSLAQIAKSSNVSKTYLGRVYKNLISDLRIEIEPPSSEKYLICLCKTFNVSEKIQDAAISLLKRVKSTGQNPLSLAAAALYLASQNDIIPLKQAEIASEGYITEVSLRNSVKLFS